MLGFNGHVLLFFMQVSSSAFAVTSVEVEEMKRKLARSTEDLEVMRQQAGQAQGNQLSYVH